MKKIIWLFVMCLCISIASLAQDAQSFIYQGKTTLFFKGIPGVDGTTLDTFQSDDPLTPVLDPWNDSGAIMQLDALFELAHPRFKHGKQYCLRNFTRIVRFDSFMIPKHFRDGIRAVDAGETIALISRDLHSYCWVFTKVPGGYTAGLFFKRDRTKKILSNDPLDEGSVAGIDPIIDQKSILRALSEVLPY